MASCDPIVQVYGGVRVLLGVRVNGVTERNLTGKTCKLLAWIDNVEKPAQARTWTPTTVVNPGLATQEVQYQIQPTDISQTNEPQDWLVQVVDVTTPFLVDPAPMRVGASPAVPP